MLLEIARLTALLLLMVGYVMLTSRQLRGLVLNYQLQSALLCIVTILLALASGQRHLWLLAVLVLVVKVLLVPWLLNALISANAILQRELDFQIQPWAVYALGALVGGLGLYAGWNLQLGMVALAATGTATFLVGILVTLLRRNALAQATGIIAAENGVMLVVTAWNTSIAGVAEAGVGLDVLGIVFIFGLLIRSLQRQHQHLDTTVLKELWG